MASSNENKTSMVQSQKSRADKTLSSYSKEQDEVEALTELSRRVSISEADNREDNTPGSVDKQDVASQSTNVLEDINDDVIIIDADNGNSKPSGPNVKETRPLYKCNCGESFEKSSELAAHKRWTCLLVEKKFQCDICKAWFAHRVGLRRHMRHLHKGDFSCSECGLKFHNQIRLTRHWMETHYDDSTGGKLTCFLCGDNSFQGKFELESHLLLHKYNRSLAERKPANNAPSTDQKAHNFINLAQSLDGEDFIASKSHSCVSKSSTSNNTLSSTTTVTRPLIHLPCSSYLPHHHSHHHCAAQYQQVSREMGEGTPTISTKLAGNPHHLPFEVLRPSTTNSNSGLPLTNPRFSSPICSHSQTQPPFVPGNISTSLNPLKQTQLESTSLSRSINSTTPSTAPSMSGAVNSTIPLHHHHHYPHPPPPPFHLPPPFPPHATPPFPPPGFRPPSPHQLFFKKHWKHQHNRWRWKQYFKSMMERYPPPWSPEFHSASPTTPGQNILSTLNASEQNHQSKSKVSDVSVSSVGSSFMSAPPTPVPSEVDSELTTDSFKVACKFCDQILDKGMAEQHRVRDCPFPYCNICGRVFRKRHRYLLHMTTCHQNPITSASSDTNSVSNLHQQLDSALDFQKGTSSLGRPEITKNNSGFQPIPPVSKPEGSGLLPNRLPDSSKASTTFATLPTALKSGLVQKATRVVYSSSSRNSPNLTRENEMDNDGDDLEEPSLVIDGLKSPVKPSNVLQCNVCRTEFDSVNIFALHLQAHITHVTAVLKVHEWKERSLKYFLDSGNPNENSSVFPDDSSITTTDASFQDTSSAKTMESTSYKADKITESEKWLKPRCEKRKKKKDWRETYSCEHCSKIFSFKKDLKHHMKEKHPEIKHKLECPVCQKKFSWKKRGQFYERHLSSHYGVTIFKHRCEICEKTYLEKGKYKAHMAIQHGKAEGLLHTCHVCGKTYGTKSSLTRHLRFHTGDKPHQCSVCQESFMEKRELTRHMATHTGQPAFECVHCGQGFTLKTSLDTHMKRKHPHTIQQHQNHQLDGSN